MKKTLKYYLKDKLSANDLKLVPSSFDIVGSILIFSSFPKELQKKEKIIADAILSEYRHITSIYKKSKKYSGTYRTPKLKLIGGVKTKETEYKENNVKIKFDVEKVYFSPRLSEERKRICKSVEENELILVMFSGCAIYPLVIGKNTKAKEIYGIELNPTAHKYALINLKLNKLENKIKLFKGDVKKVLLKINKKFDRIIMPLPKGAEKFLDLALNKIKKNGVINFYSFSKEDEYDKITATIHNECKKQNKKCQILNIVKCGQFSPRVFRVCVDFVVK